ncbi:MAG: winged helix-turn-helix domain-containing protein, partial [Gammaproteobacteria bacterium]|nr:winged helix-turn-helix domain-containing protein [Gammaproteobacteria bacterium]
MNNGTVRIGQCELDLADNNLRDASGNETHLPHKAARVLYTLAVNSGDMVSREIFVDNIWDGNYLNGPNRLNDEIWKIRRALGQAGASGVRIKTIPRKGYCLLVDKHADGPAGKTQDLKALRQNMKRLPRTVMQSALALMFVVGLVAR